MPDIPLWTVDLEITRTKLGKRVTSCVRQIVLRCVLEQIPGLDEESYRPFAESVRDDLQRAATTITGTQAEMSWIANTIAVHFSLEHMEKKTDDTKERVEDASYWASKIYKHLRDPFDSVRKVPDPPKKATARSLFGDE